MRDVRPSCGWCYRWLLKACYECWESYAGPLVEQEVLLYSQIM